MEMNDNQETMLDIEELQLIHDLLLEYISGATIVLSVYSSKRSKYIKAFKIIEYMISEMKEGIKWQ